ncbi:MAG: response regulator [Planctomycetaceae bacterium]
MLAVLLVDDDAGICSSLSRILRQDGYRVDIAHSAAEAIDRDHWNDYFAILLDRRLPDNSADDLLPRIIERAPDAAVIVVTGYADLESSLAAIRAGAADYLLKPVDPDDLRGRLRRFADLKEARDNVRRRDAQVAFMISHLPAGAAYVDNRTDEVRVNETVEAMTEYSASDLATRDLWFSHLLGSRADEFRQQYEVDRLEGFSKSRILPLKTRSGREISAEFSAYRYNDHACLDDSMT